MVRLSALLLSLVSMVSLAAEPGPAKPADAPVAKPPRNRIMIMLDTKVVVGKKLKGPASEYQHDNDPNTIELVILGRDDPGPSRVSEDGEIIFQKGTRVSDDEADGLLQKAFDIREQREKESANPSP
jgi:hypothetical protein